MVTQGGVAGTSGPDILRGTNGAGKLLGKGVNDVLLGLAAGTICSAEGARTGSSGVTSGFS
jgi:hypothetical protein